MLSILRSIRIRLAVIIVLAMTALVGFLVYSAVDEHEDEVARADADLQRLAVFAAQAQREKYDAAENLLHIAARGSAVLQEAAHSPDDVEAHESCTNALRLADDLVPGSQHSLWDTSGSLLCSSQGGARGELSAKELLWFRTVTERQSLATGGFERTPNGKPALGFAVPIRGGPGDEGAVVGYLSSAVTIDPNEDLVQGASLPPSTRMHVVDQNGVIITSTQLNPGDHVPWFPEPAFSGLDDYLSTDTAAGQGRRGVATRVTDSGDALVAVVISGESDELVSPLYESLFDQLVPVAVLAALTLGAVWFLGHRWIVRPVEALVGASRRLAAGDLGARALQRSSVTEFDHLSLAFNEMAAARQQAMQAKDDFLGLVSHELRTPITTALGNAEILLRRGDSLDAEQRREALRDIQDSARRLTELVDNLLVLARLERGIVLEGEPVSIARIAESVAVDELRRRPGARVEVLGDGGMLVVGVETYVRQVLQNLIGNALKYGAASDEPVAVVIERDGEQARVRVRDRGPGLDEEELEAVFEPFFRSQRTSMEAGGIGVGLAVCARLVEAMGGSIWCRNREGGGSEFTFTLPALVDVDEAAERREVPEAEAAPAV